MGATCAAVNETERFGTTLTVQGCNAFKSECREVVLDGEETKVVMPGVDERYSAEDIRFLDIMSGRMFRREYKHYIPSAFEI